MFLQHLVTLGNTSHYKHDKWFTGHYHIHFLKINPSIFHVVPEIKENILKRLRKTWEERHEEQFLNMLFVKPRKIVIFLLIQLSIKLSRDYMNVDRLLWQS